MAKSKKEFDAADYLDSPEAIAEYLSEAFETGDDDFITQAIGTVARVAGMSAVARDADVSRENLYKALKTGGRPEFSTVMKVLGALNIRLVAKPNEAA
jgi:probable addiction module antidote protein